MSEAGQVRLAALREQFQTLGLDEAGADPDPFLQFDRWMADVVSAGLPEPDAMVVATADALGAPSVRFVLLKGIVDGGFQFFTNYLSAKGDDLAANPCAALVFPWFPLQRQVRVSGRVSRLSAEASDSYFASRPRGAQVGAWASEQSAVIADRATLEAAAEAAVRRFADGPIPRPAHWGGYRVAGEVFEFWQGRADRLHDRLRYRRDDQRWLIERLAP